VNNLVMRLMQMPPDRRREFLQSNERLRQLPVGSRAAIERRLKQIDEMPEDERELLIQRYQLFSRLGPNQQATARSLYEDWQSMPRERRQEMTEAVRRLRQTPAAEREQALGAQRFQRRFSKQEQEMVRQLLKMTPPQAPSSARP
jgi:plasmid maintenance system killer protein